MHTEVKLLIWENNQEISWVKQNMNAWLQGTRISGAQLATPLHQPSCLGKQNTALRTIFRRMLKPHLSKSTPRGQEPVTFPTPLSSILVCLLHPRCSHCSLLSFPPCIILGNLIKTGKPFSADWHASQSLSPLSLLGICNKINGGTRWVITAFKGESVRWLCGRSTVSVEYA